MLFPTFVFAETYSCKYEELSQIKYINFDRTTHSHFTRCIQDKCSEYKYSVIFANNDNLIIGDKDENKESYFLFIINKNTNSFTAANISLNVDTLRLSLTFIASNSSFLNLVLNTFLFLIINNFILQ